MVREAITTPADAFAGELYNSKTFGRSYDFEPRDMGIDDVLVKLRVAMRDDGGYVHWTGFYR